MEDLQKYGNWSVPDLPILLIHGNQDDVVPLEHSRSFAREGSRITEFYPATGVHHLGNVISQITPVLINWLASILSV